MSLDHEHDFVEWRFNSLAREPKKASAAASRSPTSLRLETSLISTSASWEESWGEVMESIISTSFSTTLPSEGLATADSGGGGGWV